MLTFVLASLLAAPPAGEPWFITLRPAVVVDAEDTGPTLDMAETPETQAAQAQLAPRLAPAKALAPKAKVRKVRSAQAGHKGR